MKRKLISMLLAACMAASAATVGVVQASASEVDPKLAQDTVQGGAILHCFDWSYNNIKANMKDIAEAGYTAVQTSPVQPPKDYTWVRHQGHRRHRRQSSCQQRQQGRHLCESQFRCG